MASITGFSSVEKLTENNYEMWKIQMKSVLVYNDLWQYVDGTAVSSEENRAEWTKKDSKALALISLSISHTQLNHIKKAETSKSAWNILRKIFESSGPVKKATLYKQLLRIEKKPNMTMTQYVNEFSSKAGQLEEVGIEIPEELLSIMLLSSLPTAYENFSVAIESRDEIPTLETLKAKLMEEEARQDDRDSQVIDDGKKNDALIARGNADREKQRSAKPKYNTKPNSQRFDGKCFNCDKVGHRSRDCRAKRRINKANNTDTVLTVIACNAELAVKSGSWCLDSGATSHMCNNRQKFETFITNERSKVYTAAEDFVESIGTGDVKINVRANRYNFKSVKIENALYVPKLRNSLLSVSSITDKGYSVMFVKNRAFIKGRDGDTVLSATRQGRLYVIDEATDQASLANNETDKNLLIWHQRYGHVNVKDLKKMKNENMVSGMNFTTKSSEFKCEICAKCKLSVLPFKNSTHHEKEALGLVHSDICGPMSHESLGGAKYFITFTDDCTGYTETTMLRNRSDALAAFKSYKQKAEKQTGRQIRKLRTDNGREYLSNDFKEFLKNEGIIHQLSVEYTPQQNGVAERKKSHVSGNGKMFNTARQPPSITLGRSNKFSHVPSKQMRNKDIKWENAI